MNGRELSRAAKRASCEVVTHPELWRRIAQRSIQVAPDLNFFEASLLLQSELETAKKHRRHMESEHKEKQEETEEKKQREEKRNEPCVNKYHLVNFIKAAGALRFSDSRVLTALVPEIFKNIKLLTPQDLSSLAESFARINLRDKDLFCLVAHSLPPYVSEFPPHTLALLLGAFARVGMYHAELIDAILITATDKASQFSGPLSLVLLSALARIQFKLPPGSSRDDTKAIDILLVPINRSLQEMSFQDILQLFGTLVALRHYDPKFINHTLLPTLSNKFLLHREAVQPDHSIQHLQTNFKSYSRLSETLMRLPPPVSLGAQRLQLDVANEAGKTLAALGHVLQPSKIDKTGVVRLLRAMKNSDLLDCPGAQIGMTFFDRLSQYSNQPLSDLLPENELRILHSAIKIALNKCNNKHRRRDTKDLVRRGGEDPITEEWADEKNGDDENCGDENGDEECLEGGRHMFGKTLRVVSKEKYIECLLRIRESLGHLADLESETFEKRSGKSRKTRKGSRIHSSSSTPAPPEDAKPFAHLEIRE